MFARAQLFGLLITGLFLGLSLWRVDLDEVGRALAAGDYRFVLPAAASTLLGYLARSVRWRCIVSVARVVPIRDLFPVLMIGFMANNVLPARMGEFVRAYALDRQASISKSLGLATIMIERVFDGLTLVTILAILSLLLPLPGWGTEAGIIGGALFLGAIVGSALLMTNESLIVRLLRAALAWAPDHVIDFAEQKTRQFTLGLGSLRRLDVIAQIVGLSALVWTLEALSYFCLIVGFGVSSADSWAVSAALFTLVTVNLGIMLPSAPGYVGTFQFFAVLALGAFGVARENALSVAMVSHLMQYALVTSIGLFFLSRLNLSLNVLGQTRAREVEQPTATGSHSVR